MKFIYLNECGGINYENYFYTLEEFVDYYSNFVDKKLKTFLKDNSFLSLDEAIDEYIKISSEYDRKDYSIDKYEDLNDFISDMDRQKNDYDKNDPDDMNIIENFEEIKQAGINWYNEKIKELKTL